MRILSMRELPLSFEQFLSVLNSLYSLEAQRELQLERRAELPVNDMVFGGDLDDLDPADPGSRIQALRAASCVKILGKGVIRVVRRVDDAKENNNLDLSNCQLMQVPDAIYYMMRNTPLIACNLSSNVITKIPPKLPAKFSFIKNLDLSHNRMSTLPEELTELTQLESVDISHNSFISLPKCLFNAQKLAKINAKKNFIAEVDVELLLSSPKLHELNLEENPLSRTSEAEVSNINKIKITFTKRELEEWEDLTI